MMDSGGDCGTAERAGGEELTVQEETEMERDMSIRSRRGRKTAVSRLDGLSTTGANETETDTARSPV